MAPWAVGGKAGTARPRTGRGAGIQPSAGPQPSTLAGGEEAAGVPGLCPGPAGPMGLQGRAGAGEGAGAGGRLPLIPLGSRHR